MQKNNPNQEFKLSRIVGKFFLSTFVVCTFVAYALHERLGGGTADALGQQLNNPTTAQTIPTLPPSQVDTGQSQVDPAQSQPPAPQNSAPSPTSVPSGQVQNVPQVQGAYRDGTYTGPQVDAYWGVVQVKAVVRNGKIASVQFLQYPSDRRTSVRINNVAIPYLQSEAIQAQSANVDIISGATLTSEAFMQSLDTALSTARTA